MGKKRKTNPGVGVDFRRVKHKVGKKLPKAQNETDLNFKSQTISLPTQSVQQDKTGAAVNQHNLTFKELMSQTSHYSDKMRKHALSGLADLFQRHPDELHKNLTDLFQRLPERITDVEGPVRQALRSLLKETVMPKLDAYTLQPFMPVLMAHLCGALTHLALDIRMDALQLLDILMDHCPQLVVPSYLAPCLSYFSDLLSAGHRGRNIKAQSVASLLKVVAALDSFLKRAFPNQQPASGSSSSGSSSGSGIEAAALAPQLELDQGSGGSGPMFPLRCAWGPLSPAACSPFGAQAMPPPSSKAKGSAAVGNSGSKHTGSNATGQQQQAGAAAASGAAAAGGMRDTVALLLERLYECWGSCSPAELSSSPELDAVQALGAILAVTHTLMTQLLLQPAAATSDTPSATANQAVLTQLVGVVLARLGPHFPAMAPAVKPTPPLADALVQYNLQALRVLVLFLPLCQMDPAAVAVAAAPQQQGSGGARGKAPAVDHRAWVHHLVNYCTGFLHDGTLLPSQGGLSEAAAGSSPASAASAALAVLEAVGAGVALLDPPTSATLLGAVSQLSRRSAARSPARAACLRLYQQLLDAYHAGSLSLDPPLVASWLQELPQLLWEVGDAQLGTTQRALALLLAAGRCSAPGTATSAALSALQPQLAPLFVLQLPGKAVAAAAGGSSKAKGSKEAAGKGKGGPSEQAVVPPVLMPGPVLKWPRQLQLMAVDAVFHLGSRLDRTLLRALLQLCCSQLLDLAVATRLVEVLTWRCFGSGSSSISGSSGSSSYSQAERQEAEASATAFLSGILVGPEPGTVQAGGAFRMTWQRQRRLADTALGAMAPGAAASAVGAAGPSAPGHVLALLGPQLQQAVAAGDADVSGASWGSDVQAQLQRYSLVQLALLAAPVAADTSSTDEEAAAAAGAGAASSASSVPAQRSSSRKAAAPASAPASSSHADVLAPVPAALSQLVLGLSTHSLGSSTSSMAAVGGQDEAVQLLTSVLGQQPSLAPAVLQGLMSRALCCVGSASSPSKGSSAQEEAGSSGRGNNGTAMFVSAVVMCQHVVRQQAAHASLLQERKKLLAKLTQLLQLGNLPGYLSSSKECIAECNRLRSMVTTLWPDVQV